MKENYLMENTNSFWSFKGEVNYVDNWMLMTTPIPLLILTISYLSFIYKIGPNLMAVRLPCKINNVLIIYNTLQVAYSVFLLYIGSQMIWQNGLLGKSCFMETPERRYIVTSSTYFYFLAKVTELLDTVFFVFRKKYNQITFLHVYHHVSMVWLSWFILKYEPSYSAMFLGTLNSFVHIIMYGYYGMAAIPELRKHLWWKKYITSLQLVQFGLILIQAAASTISNGCPPSYTLITMIYVNCLLFIYLFGKFYVNSYLNAKEKKKDVTNK